MSVLTMRRAQHIQITLSRFLDAKEPITMQRYTYTR